MYLLKRVCGFVWGKKKRVEEQSGCVCIHVYLHPCISVTLFPFVCSCVDKDLETGLSIPGSQSPSVVTANDLHMVPANAGYSNIPVYSNVQADYFA